MAKIVIIDDSRTIINLMKTRLSKLGHTIVGTGSDGTFGLSLYTEFKPDLVILDITMPNKSGRECLKEIMQNDPSAKIIMLSSVANKDVVSECLRSGAKAFINKDTLGEANEIEEQIDKVLRGVA